MNFDFTPEQDEAAELAGSFAFERCVVREPLAEILRTSAQP